MNRRKFFKLSSIAAATLAAPSIVAGNVNRHGVNETPSCLPRRCKVTVLRRECYTDFQSQYLDEPETGPCHLFKTGQEFIIDRNNYDDMTKCGFCPKAWKCISQHVDDVLGNSQSSCDVTPAKHAPVIACCNDGTRPVIFKIETA